MISARPLILHGTPVATALRAKLQETVHTCVRAPHLCIVQVGDDFASGRYIEQKRKAAARIGVTVSHIHLPAEVTAAVLIRTLQEQNKDPLVDGIILQAPIPAHLSFAEMLACIDPQKDVDGLHPYNQGALRTHTQFHLPCTPYGIMELLSAYAIPLVGAHVGIINRSTIVGRPLADLLLNAHATVTICHSQTKELARIARTWDIIISAVGSPGFITPEYCHPDTVVIDVGCSYTTNGFRGDLSPEAATLVAGYSPAPGGVGPMTVTMLLHNTVRAYQQRHPQNLA